MQNHRLFIVRLLELLSAGRERICICESEEYPKGKVEVRPHDEANGELYGHVQFYKDRSCLSFYKENPALIIRFIGKEPNQVLDTIMAKDDAVWFCPLYGDAVVARYEDFPYESLRGFVNRRPL